MCMYSVLLQTETELGIFWYRWAFATVLQCLECGQSGCRWLSNLWYNMLQWNFCPCNMNYPSLAAHYRHLKIGGETPRSRHSLAMKTPGGHERHSGIEHFLPASKDLHVSPCPFVPLWWHCATEIFRLISYVSRTDSLRSLGLLRELRLLMFLFWTQSTQSCRRVRRGAWSGIEHFAAASKPPCFSVPSCGSVVTLYHGDREFTEVHGVG